MIANADWILTKNGIIKKTIALLDTIQNNQQQYLEKVRKQLPPEVLEKSPKISKGENYQGLPYLILDYPRVFDKKNILAIRTFFWWGNFFSTTLHLSGSYKKQYEENILLAFTALKKEGFSVCVNEKEWEHHFETNNYLELQQCRKNNFKKIISDSSFVKLAKKVSLQNWNEAHRLLVQDFKKLSELVLFQLPSR